MGNFLITFCKKATKIAVYY